MNDQDRVLEIEFILLNLGLNKMVQIQVEFEVRKHFRDSEEIRLVLIRLLQERHLQIARSDDEKWINKFSVEWQVQHCSHWYNLGTYELHLFLTESGAALLEKLKTQIKVERQFYLTESNKQMIWELDNDEYLTSLNTFCPPAGGMDVA